MPSQQYQHQGPFLSAAWKRDVLRVNDLESDDRWPAYRRDVLRSTPIRAVLSFRLFTTARSVGALMIYANEPHAFDRHAEEIGYVVATQPRWRSAAHNRSIWFDTCWTTGMWSARRNRF